MSSLPHAGNQAVANPCGVLLVAFQFRLEGSVFPLTKHPRGRNRLRFVRGVLGRRELLVKFGDALPGLGAERGKWQGGL